MQGKLVKDKLLTSWGEAKDLWASRETPGSLAFFERLGFQGTGTFFTEALVTLGATSWAGGSSSTAGGMEGVPVIAFDGSSSSLQEAKTYE
jgi:hypothetical protein